MYNTYSNYTTCPSYPSYTSYGDYPTAGVGSHVTYTSFEDDDDDRFIGPLAPFLLGGIAGAAVAPYFYRPFPYYAPFYGPYGPFF